MISQLSKIHDSSSNIIEWERDISLLNHDISQLLNQRSKLQVTGDREFILSQLIEHTTVERFSKMYEDVDELLTYYMELTDVVEYDFLLSTIEDNMCTKFHYDINKIRLICTYSGPGTLWISNTNVDWAAIHESQTNDEIVIDKNKIFQAKTGSVIVLKGAMYNKSEVPPVVHCSPPIEHLNEKRLLLRIDSKRKDFIS